jgi:hypothetical protein
MVCPLGTQMCGPTLHHNTLQLQGFEYDSLCFTFFPEIFLRRPCLILILGNCNPLQVITFSFALWTCLLIGTFLIKIYTIVSSNKMGILVFGYYIMRIIEVQTVSNKLITLILPNAFSWHRSIENLFIESMCLVQRCCQ